MAGNSHRFGPSGAIGHANPARQSPGCSSGTSGTSHKCYDGSRGGRRIHVLAGFAYFYPGAAAFGAKDAGRHLRRPEQPGLPGGGRTGRRQLPERADHLPGVVFPPGAKTRECDPYSPARWVQQKSDSAVARYGLEQFDADPYWQVAHTAGLTSPQLRVLDCTAARSPVAGRVGERACLTDRIKIGSAMADPDDHLRTLQALGWVTVVDTPDRGTGLPRTYRLTRSPTGSDEPATPLPPVPTPPPTRQG